MAKIARLSELEASPVEGQWLPQMIREGEGEKKN